MSGRELRDAVLQHGRLAIEQFTKNRVSPEHFSGLEKSFDLVLFGAPLAGDEPINCENHFG
jgi:hypothetical protein